MKFIYLDKEGNQIGPVDESAVVQGILSGELTAETAIRNALLREFRTVAEFDCFAEALAQVVPSPPPEAEIQSKRSGFSYLRSIAQKRVEEEQKSTISAKLHAGDAKVLRRLLAMLMDSAILLPIIVVIFIPSITVLRFRGTQDVSELARQKKAREVQIFTSKSARQKVDQTALTEDATAALEDASQQEKARHQQNHSVNRAAINKLLPGVLQKVDSAYLKHNERIEKANQGTENTPPKQKSAKPASKPAVKKVEYNQEVAEYEASKLQNKNKKEKNITTAAYLMLQQQERPQVLLVNMPGGKIVSSLLPSMMQQWEDRFYADGFNNPADAESIQNNFILRNILLTGYAEDSDGVLLRTGGDIRKLTYTDLTAHFSEPLKWAALVFLLYYTLAFAIFAQTVGMWFWGIFLTRSQLAEVLPLRALLYTMTMLLFGVFMIPAVLITKRSVADWICGVRQVGVGSVSKAS